MKNKLIISRILGIALTIYIVTMGIYCYKTGNDLRPYIDDILRAAIVFIVIKAFYKKIVE